MNRSLALLHHDATARVVVALTVALACTPPALGQRGGRGGGRPGAGAGARPSGPQPGGMQQPGAGRGGEAAAPGGPGRAGGPGPGAPGGEAPRVNGPGQAGPGPGAPGAGRPGGGGPGAAGPGIGAPGAAGPADRRDVESFIGAKPAARPSTGQAHAESMQAALSGRTQPFTSTWYAEHPSAWQDPHADAAWWAVPGTAAVCRWLAVPMPPTASAPTAAAATTADAAGAAAASEPPANPEWMPLGVFASAPRGTTQAHLYQQLAVSRTGDIKGNYYDAVADAVQPITGRIDRDSRQAAWTVGKGARFETTLDALLQPQGEATMTAGSATQTWDLVQMEKPAVPAKP